MDREAGTDISLHFVKFDPRTYFIRNADSQQPPPPPLKQTFPAPEIFAAVKDSNTKSFGTVRQKKFDRKPKIVI